MSSTKYLKLSKIMINSRYIKSIELIEKPKLAYKINLICDTNINVFSMFYHTVIRTPNRIHYVESNSLTDPLDDYNKVTRFINSS